MLFKIILTFEGLSTDLTSEGNIVLVTTLVDHKIVRFGKTTLTILADKFYCALCTHLLPTTKFSAVAFSFHWHYREHLE